MKAPDPAIETACDRRLERRGVRERRRDDHSRRRHLDLANGNRRGVADANRSDRSSLLFTKVVTDGHQFSVIAVAKCSPKSTRSP